jgi:ATP/maltotriose-dependent transcriptional regulator MalT
MNSPVQCAYRQQHQQASEHNPRRVHPARLQTLHLQREAQSEQEREDGIELGGEQGLYQQESCLVCGLCKGSPRAGKSPAC